MSSCYGIKARTKVPYFHISKAESAIHRSRCWQGYTAIVVIGFI